MYFSRAAARAGDFAEPVGADRPGAPGHYCIEITLEELVKLDAEPNAELRITVPP